MIHQQVSIRPQRGKLTDSLSIYPSSPLSMVLSIFLSALSPALCLSLTYSTHISSYRTLLFLQFFCLYTTLSICLQSLCLYICLYVSLHIPGCLPACLPPQLPSLPRSSFFQSLGSVKRLILLTMHLVEQSGSLSTDFHPLHTPTALLLDDYCISYVGVKPLNKEQLRYMNCPLVSRLTYYSTNG